MKPEQTRAELVRTGNRFLKMMADGEKPKHIMAGEGLSHWTFWRAIYAARDAKFLSRPAILIASHRRDALTRAPWSYCDGDLLKLVRETKAEMEKAVATGWWTPERGFNISGVARDR